MDYLVFVVLLGACAAAATTGSLFPPGQWYKAMKKPGWTPPDWLFPVAWTTLYLCMSVAGARVALLEAPALPLALWGLQIALNTLWTPVFFGKRMILGGLVVLSFLWLAVLLTLISFWSRDTVAGVLMVPYLAWVSTASALNYSVWRLNPSEV